MTEKVGTSNGPGSYRVGVLTRDVHVRILNYSPSGCLLETSARVEPGTIGSLCFVIDGSEFIDDVQVVRCQPIEGAGARYRVGARFLWTVAPGRGTLRGALQRTNGSAESAEAAAFT